MGMGTGQSPPPVSHLPLGDPAVADKFAHGPLYVSSPPPSCSHVHGAAPGLASGEQVLKSAVCSERYAVQLGHAQ